MAVSWSWCGALRDDGFVVAARIDGLQGSVSVTSTDGDTATFGPVDANAAGVVKIDVAGLASDAVYEWHVVDDGVASSAWSGQARTLPPTGQPASFSFAAAGDAGLGTDGGDTYITNRVSNRPVFDTIRERAPLFFCHMGDLHYRDITTGAAQDYRDAYHDVLTYNGTEPEGSRQGRLYRTVPTMYVWDDHDYSDNNSDGTYAGKDAAAQAYRECVPHYPLPGEDPEGDGAGGVYQAWQVGRVQFVMLDERYYRDPSSDPDVSGKDMIGADQRAWLRGVLESTDAQALVLLTPVQWLSPGSESWGGYSWERGQVQDILTDTGWAPDRMIALQADRHSLGMDTGASNDWGGFPNYVLASLDANPSDPTDRYDLGDTPARDQWGMIHVRDLGSVIEIEAVGYREGEAVISHTVTIAAEDTDGDDTLPPPTTPAVVRRRVTWLACNAVDGRVITELPDLSGSISRVLGQHTSSRLTLPIPPSGPASLPPTVWDPATAPGRAMLVAVIHDVPAWGGIVVRREGGTVASLDLTAVSLEGYLDRRYVGDHRWVLRDEARIAADLVRDAEPDGINLTIDAPNTGTLRDRQYHHDEDATIYDRLTELMGVEHGPEWTIDVDWANEQHTAVEKIFRLRKHIGRVATNPPAVFDSRGPSSATYTFAEDYSAKKGANHIIATGRGEGEDRPESSPWSLVPPGWPRYERRISPSSAISSVDVLNEHAIRELALARHGARVFELDTRWNGHPRLNIDWGLGDDVAWDLAGHRHPNGVQGRGRVIGWELDLEAETVRPMLYDESED